MKLCGKVALITGASGGLGSALAKKLASEGAELLLLARSVEALEKLDDTLKPFGKQATLIPYDLNQWTGLEHLTQPIFDQYGRLDILVGCAAQLGTLSPLPHGAPEEWERIFRVNVLANWNLLRMCDPLLRLSKAARVLFATCPQPKDLSYWGLYYSSQAALETLVKTYAHEVAHTSIRVNLANPGPLPTKLRQSAFPGESLENLPSPEAAADALLPWLLPECTDHGQVVNL